MAAHGVLDRRARALPAMNAIPAAAWRSGAITQGRWTPRLVAACLVNAAEGPAQPQEWSEHRVNQPLPWLEWLDEDLRQVAWGRANKRPWKAIAFELGIDRTTAWRRWTCAMVTIAARLNAAVDATSLQHHDQYKRSGDPVD